MPHQTEETLIRVVGDGHHDGAGKCGRRDPIAGGPACERLADHGEPFANLGADRVGVPFGLISRPLLVNVCG